MQVKTHEPEDMKMWGCKDTNKHPEYMNLRVRGCEDEKIKASTHKHKDMRIRGCKDKSRGTGTKVFEDMRMWGYKQYVTCRLKIQKNMS